MYSKILIANRGEVAVRIIRALHEMGIQSVAIYSEADRNALHVSMADESYCIGGPLLADSYLNMDAILTVATSTGVQAIHPGYGMLAENPEFARQCAELNIDFIGPDEDVMRLMGHKDRAREAAIRADVPVVTGSPLLATVEEAMRCAAECGYPVILKARAGGGGKGIRIVRNEAELENAYNTVKLEAGKAFGDDAVFLEKYLEDVKHIEVQLLADKYGNVLVLGDRDCSVQRKNQKLIEECPAPLLDENVRQELYAASVRLAKEVGYTTVGTIEYLMEKNGKFYFMEMNTRLQVEHSVTEMVCGVDIVKWQIRTANGENLVTGNISPFTHGHAIECRINAENPVDFRPSCGTIELLHIPGGMDVRFDTAIYQGYDIPPFYDSMLGKLIVHAATREEAIRKMKSALSEIIITGVEHNRDMQASLMELQAFADGTYNTKILRG